MQNRLQFREWRTFPSYGFLFGQFLYACASLHGTSARAGGVESELAGAWAEPGNCDVTFVAKNGGWPRFTMSNRGVHEISDRKFDLISPTTPWKPIASSERRSERRPVPSHYARKTRTARL